MPDTKHTAENGFTLVETLIAFTILAVSMVVILQSFTTGLRSLETAESYARAAMMAQSKLVEFGTLETIKSGQFGGELDDGFTWRAAVEPYETGDAGTGVVGRALSAYRIDLTVTWRGGREVTLSTLRLSEDE